MTLMPWGRHRGRAIADVPSSYLCWVLESANNPERALKEAIKKELGERFGTVRTKIVYETVKGPGQLERRLRPLGREIVQRGYRACAKDHHPDVGGDHDAMITLADARDALLKWVA